jgi:hypothetical protein
VRVHPLAPVVGIDIDGNLGDYHGHFRWFLENIYFPGRAWPPYWDPTYEGEFSDALGLEKHAYRDAKLAYRMGGLKRCMPLFENDYKKDGENSVRREIQYLRSQGIQVWICTSRPWLSLTTVDPDTQFWLDRNVGKVDGLIYGEDKYLDLIDIVGKDRIIGVIDDLPDNILRAKELELRSAIRLGDHNRWWAGRGSESICDRIYQIKDMSSIIDGWMESK